MTWKVALPMYNVSPRIRGAYEALMEALIDVLRVGGWKEPIELVRDPVLPDFWLRPDMLFSQTCGYPYMMKLRGHVRLMATPCYLFPGCSGMDYSSVIVARENSGMKTLADARGCNAAVNDMHSNSGMNFLRHAVAPQARDGRFFAKVKFSGSHLTSLAMLRHGEADVAAVDCVTFAYVRQENPAWVEGLSILQYSVASPGLPMIVANALPEDQQAQLRSALLKPTEHVLDLLRSLHIHEFRSCADQDYERVMQIEREAQALSYPTLA